MMGLLAVLTLHFCVIRHSKYVTKSPFSYHIKEDKQKERRLRIPCSTTAKAISPKETPSRHNMTGRGWNWLLLLIVITIWIKCG